MGISEHINENIPPINLGFDFDDFGGNVDVVIVKGDKNQLGKSSCLNSLKGSWKLEQDQAGEWSFYNGTTYPPEGIETLARELSKEFSTKAIYFYFGDASGWMGYKLFISGEECEEYSFGVDYDEEMAEYGIDLSERRKAGTVVTNNEVGDQCVFWSSLRTMSEFEITAGEKFIDDFLKEERAYIGWDLFSNP